MNPVSLTFLGSGDAFGSGGRFQTCLLIDERHMLAHIQDASVECTEDGLVIAV